ncbi:hypothetical protein T03_6160 [Trichinella britovi]|uniref:Uncharacterized protein n=1 Tax=Trichinella britovi TaxID=45882 RepID=A0A0V1C960_TRIBR|nr:hypothetical protein T03_6160 [Trichinella britovi]
MPETDDDRTVRFTLTNLIQMWRQTLNQDAFRRTHTHQVNDGVLIGSLNLSMFLYSLNCNVVGEIGTLFDYVGMLQSGLNPRGSHFTTRFIIGR